MENNIISFASIGSSIQPNESSIITKQELLNETSVTLTINLNKNAKVAEGDVTITLPLNCHYAVEMHPEVSYSFIEQLEEKTDPNYLEDERIFFVKGGGVIF